MFNRRFGGVRTMTALLRHVASQRHLEEMTWLDVAGGADTRITRVHRTNGRDQVDVTGRQRRARLDGADAAAGDRGIEDEDHVAGGVDTIGRRRERERGLRTVARVDVAFVLPDEDVAAAESEDARGLDVHIAT